DVRWLRRVVLDRERRRNEEPAGEVGWRDLAGRPEDRHAIEVSRHVVRIALPRGEVGVEVSGRVDQEGDQQVLRWDTVRADSQVERAAARPYGSLVGRGARSALLDRDGDGLDREVLDVEDVPGVDRG